MEVLERAERVALPRAVPALLLAVLLLLVAGDAAARQAESDRLLAAVTAGQEAARYAERRVAATAEYAGPALTRAAVDEAVRADLRALVRSEARAQVPALRAAERAVRDVPALPWHGDVRAGRDAYAESLAALGDHLDAVEEDLRGLYTRPDVLRATSSRAREALRGSLPADRVARLLP